MIAADSRRAAEDALRLAAMFSGLAELGSRLTSLASIEKAAEEAQSRLTRLDSDWHKRKAAIAAEESDLRDLAQRQADERAREIERKESAALETLAEAEAASRTTVEQAKADAAAIRLEIKASEEVAKQLTQKARSAESRLDATNKRLAAAEAIIARADRIKKASEDAA